MKIDIGLLRNVVENNGGKVITDVSHTEAGIVIKPGIVEKSIMSIITSSFNSLDCSIGGFSEIEDDSCWYSSDESSLLAA